jgi:phage tail protein X
MINKQQYITVSGDMWDSVAYKIWGNEMYTDKLIKSNLQYKNVFIFPAGITLNIPGIETKTSADLPPWKQVVL